MYRHARTEMRSSSTYTFILFRFHRKIANFITLFLSKKKNKLYFYTLRAVLQKYYLLYVMYICSKHSRTTILIETIREHVQQFIDVALHRIGRLLLDAADQFLPQQEDRV